ncbi:acyl-CoA dehydrogenase family protein [Tardiphaga sp. OK245]|uniref:acyl-CoA dehydrogenase family protein n=1 Tax=Tardiphaga sp. OK245 TaxID=1855306 RepID=UPI0008A80DFF|nr:acyl-CoA dehydrogenase family protein [Tardiphaga sp. OK245]SEH40714.1 Acyl-CoA dehydrogenase [Tardiphaga sp. OK245]
MNRAIAVAEELAHSVLRPNAPLVDRAGDFPRISIDAIRDSELLGLMIPIELGGLGASTMEFSQVMRTLGNACASTAMIFLMHVTSVSPLVAHFRQAQRDRFLSRIVAGKCLVTEAISEPGSGSQWWSLSSTAEAIGSGYRIRADKSWATTAGHADLYVVSTRAPGAESDRDHAVFVVDANLPGISFGSWSGLGLSGNMSTWMRFDTLVDNDALVFGKGSDGLRQYNEANQPIYHLGLSSIYLGIAEAARDATIERVRNRKYHADAAGFGTSLSDYPTAQTHVGGISIKLWQLESAVTALARLMSTQSDFEKIAVPMTATKVAAAETAVDVCRECMLACGGLSYVRNVLPIERHLRDALAGSLMGPTDDFCKMKIGKMLLRDESYHKL